MEHPGRFGSGEFKGGRWWVTDEGWADTPGGVVAVEWVGNYVDEVFDALGDGRLASAHHLTDPRFVAEGLQGARGRRVRTAAHA